MIVVLKLEQERSFCNLSRVLKGGVTLDITVKPVNEVKETDAWIINKKMTEFKQLQLIQVDQKHFLFIGTDKDKVTTEDIRYLGGEVRKKLIALETFTNVQIDFQELAKQFGTFPEMKVVTAFLEGWKLGGYDFTEYKKEAHQVDLILDIDQVKYQEALRGAGKTADAINIARDLCNEPANKLTPAIYAKRIKAIFKDTNAKVEIIDTDELGSAGFHATAIVGAGSKDQPKAAIISLKNANVKHVALVGKGITFDTGGTNVKTMNDIGEMKMDMGGSAAVVGAMKLLTDTKAPVHVTAIIPLATNVTGREAFLPSDVITYQNGTTVEVGNTDAEGRLVLADGILYAQEVGAETIIDIATLTGTIGQALGLKSAGIFTNQEEDLWTYKRLGEETGDHVWPMPVTLDYQTYIESDTADINNMSSSPFGGAITAALFLHHFVEKGKKWVHIDMANTVRPWKVEGYHVKGAAGYGVRLLSEIVLADTE